MSHYPSKISVIFRSRVDERKLRREESDLLAREGKTRIIMRHRKVTTLVGDGLSGCVGGVSRRSIFHINADCQPHFYPRLVGISIPSRFVDPDAKKNNLRRNIRQQQRQDYRDFIYIYGLELYLSGSVYFTR